MRIPGFLKLFDRFKRPIFLFSNKAQNHSTNLGFFVSLSIYGFILYYLINSDMIKRTNPKITDQSVESSFRPEITLINMVFDVSDEDSVSYVDTSIFSVQANIRYMKVNEETNNGFEFVYDIHEDLRLCRDADFDYGVYEERGFKNKFCFKNKSITIKGFWEEKEVKYVWVKLLRCVNTTENNNSCKSDEEIDKFLFKKYFNIYFVNPYFDLSDYNNPVKSLWRNEYQYIDPNTNKRFNLFYKKVEFLDDKNIPFVPATVLETYSFEKRESDLFIETRTSTPFEMIMYSSIIVQRKVRIYQGLPDVLANITGLFGILVFIGFFVTEPEFRLNIILGLFFERLTYRKQIPNFGGGPFHKSKSSENVDFIKGSPSPRDPAKQRETSDRCNEEAKKEKIQTIKSKKVYSHYIPQRPYPSENEIIIRTDDEPQEKKEVHYLGPVSNKMVGTELAKLQEDGKSTNVETKSKKRACIQSGGPGNELEKQLPGMENDVTEKDNWKDVKFLTKNEVIDNAAYTSHPKKDASYTKSYEEGLNFTICDYLYYLLKRAFNLRLSNKQKFFFKLEEKYLDELNVGNILQRIFLLESEMDWILSDEQIHHLQSKQKFDPSARRPIVYKKYTVSDLVKT